MVAAYGGSSHDDHRVCPFHERSCELTAHFFLPHQLVVTSIRDYLSKMQRSKEGEHMEKEPTDRESMVR